MKQKDIVYLAISAVIFIIGGFLAVSQLHLLGNKKQGDVTVEVVQPIPSGYDVVALNQLIDPQKSRDFTVPIDLTTGFGNFTPFQPF